MKKKKGLGRGLSALFGDEKSENKPKSKNIRVLQQTHIQLLRGRKLSHT